MRTKTCGYRLFLFLMISGVLIFLFIPFPSEAKDRIDRDRIRFYGWVELMPKDLHGTWIIGGQEVSTHPRTEFDQFEGPLMVGGCAKVDIRGGLVHEIDSEPKEDCLRRR